MEIAFEYLIPSQSYLLKVLVASQQLISEYYDYDALGPFMQFENRDADLKVKDRSGRHQRWKNDELHKVLKEEATLTGNCPTNRCESAFKKKIDFVNGSTKKSVDLGLEI